jgi:hypothetical protein
MGFAGQLGNHEKENGGHYQILDNCGCLLEVVLIETEEDG